MPKKKLNQLEATAICGNDISSSCLYVSALAIFYAGQYAWISLLMVAGVLYLFRSIYGEVVGALPLNGGAYNALLNTSKKSVASLAASLTVISYMATAVISASEGVKYAHSIWEIIPVLPTTIGLLLLFMGLVILGIGESSKVAVFIFIFHLVSLTLLVGFCGYYIFEIGLDTLFANFRLPVKGGIVQALFFGFSAAMLGISGFESSANFVEEQKKGVFPKTLRNMWIVVSIFNPLLAFLALVILPVATVNNNQDALLSLMGELSGGNWLSLLVGVDAALVLSGAVLTSYVGVGGLMERMALDGILPSFLLKKNKNNSPYWVFILFFGLCTSILFITHGDLAKLAGVYTIAFLSVMILFGVGNILLKTERRPLVRPERASWWSLIIAISAVGLAIVGNLVLNPAYFIIFLEYMTPTLFVVYFMLFRIQILRATLSSLSYFFRGENEFFNRWSRKLKGKLAEINSHQIVFFTHLDNVEILNRVMLYIEKNEPTHRVKIVSVQGKGFDDTGTRRDLEVLDRAYPNIDIEYIIEEGVFNAAKIKELSDRWHIPVNYMFVGTPGKNAKFNMEDLGEVRLII